MARRTLDIPANTSLEDVTRLINDNFRRLEGLTAGSGTSGRAVTAAAPLPPSSVKVARDGSYFAGSVARTLDEKAGEHPSFLDFGAVGDGVVDDQSAIQAGLNGVAAAGGGAVLIPGGYTFRLAASLTVPADIHLVGQGETSIILRGANMADGRGVLHLSGGRNVLRDFLIEGDVTTAATVAYEAFDGDPRNVILTKNTSIWLDRVKDVKIRNVVFSHTGGYSAYCDRSSRVEFVDNFCRNCRPHTFGTNAGPTAGLLHFGSWTGGFLVVGDGTDMCDDIYFAGNGCSRHTGTHIWSWAPSVSGNLHTGIECIGNFGQDIGRDGILIGAALGPVVKGNFYHRLGYITTSDSGGAGTPRWLRNHWAVGVDTSGLTRGAVYEGNVVVSACGGAMDLDGFAYSSCKGNLMYVPEPGTPEYIEDRISEWVRALESGEPGYPGTTAVQAYGINLGDTQNNVGGSAANIDGNVIRNCGGGAIRMYGAINCSVTGNLIDHPANAQSPPVALGRGGAGVNQGCKGNLVTGNHIAYEPAAAVPAIFEDATLGALDGPNRVYGNFINSALSFEFQPHSSSGSSTAVSLTTATAAVATREEMRFQVEGTGSAKALKLYAVAAATVAQVMSITKAGFVNASDNGAAGTGNYATGNRTTAAWGDAMHSGKIVGDGFFAVRGYGSGTFSSTEANALDNTWACWRFNETSNEMEVSVDTLAGARVWIPWAAAGGGAITVPGANTEVIFNDAGALGADAGFVYNKTLNLLTVAGSAGQAGVALAAGWMQAPGFLATGSAADSINVPSGGVTALSHIAARNDGASGFTLARSSATARTWGFGIDGSGQLFVRDETAAANRLTFDTATGRATFGAQVVVGGAASGAGLLVQDGYTESTEGFYSPFTSYQTFQAPNGGMFARSHASSVYTKVGTSFGAPTATAGDSVGAGAIYFDTGSNSFLGNNGFGFVPLGGGVSSVSSLSANLAASPTTGAVTLNFSNSPTFASLFLNGGGQVLTASGSILASGGFNSQSGAFNSIQTIGGTLSSSGYYVGSSFSPQTAIDSGRNHFGASYKNTGGSDLINVFGQFVGTGGVVVGSAPVGSARHDFFNGSFYEPGFTQTLTVTRPGGSAILAFKGGVCTLVSLI